MQQLTMHERLLLLSKPSPMEAPHIRARAFELDMYQGGFPPHYYVTGLFA